MFFYFYRFLVSSWPLFYKHFTLTVNFSLTTLFFIYTAIPPNLKENSKMAIIRLPKFINIAELLTKSYKNLLAELDFVKSSALFIDLVSNSAAELLPFSSFPLNLEELLYFIFTIKGFCFTFMIFGKVNF
jgi:hypothetical protein